METDPKDFWMLLKSSWTPQPRWLSSESADRADPPGQAPVLLPSGQHMRHGEPAIIVAFKGDLGHSSRGIAPISAREKTKGHRDVRSSSSTRADNNRTHKRVEEETVADPGAGFGKRSQKMPSSLKIRNKRRKVQQGNVVELRPRRLDEICASEILNALCAACESHAAGEDELLMARIKMLYHMFDDVVR